MKKFIIITLLLILPFLYNIKIKNKDNENIGVETNKINKVNEVLAYTCTTCDTIPSTFPKKEDGYSVESVTCTNGAIGMWDHKTWTLETSNISGKTSCLVDFMPGFKVTVISENENVTPSNSSQIVYGEDASIEINAKVGYGIRNLSCNKGTYDPITHTLTVVNITSDMTVECEIVTQESGNSFYTQILADNPNVSTRNSFSSTFTTSNNGNTIYSAAGQDNKTTYYFAGNVTNNYVYFAGLYWRIVRINEDGSVRLIYAGTSATDTTGFSSTSQKFNSSYRGSVGSVYVGYKYTSGSQYGLDTNSAIKTHLDSWYTSNLNGTSTVDGSGNEYDKYISRTAIYCNDRTVGTGSWVASGSTVYYASYTRLYTNKAPTYVCSQLNDRFTTSTTTGNGELYNASGAESPIATITADELSYAGGVFSVNNTSYYIYQNAVSGASFWWTMTPYRWGDDTYARVWYVGGSSYGGVLSNAIVNNTHGVRPVVSLKSCVEWSEGNGTAAHPYQVSINSSCISAEN